MAKMLSTTNRSCRIVGANLARSLVVAMDRLARTSLSAEHAATVGLSMRLATIGIVLVAVGLSEKSGLRMSFRGDCRVSITTRSLRSRTD
jgi:hypothetical protein